MPTAVFLDGSGLFYRYYYAYAKYPLKTADGRPTSVVYGLVKILDQIYREIKPDRIALAADSKGPTFRHALDVNYKAQRPAMPDDLKVQLPETQKLFSALHVPYIHVPGMEADDILATLALQSAKDGYDVLIVSSDKDMCQLVSPSISLYDPGKGATHAERRLGSEYVQQKFGVTPELIVDYLSLIGDASDNIPGVQNIGPKTAAKLLNQFGNGDKLFEQLDKVPSASTRKHLQDGRDSFFASRELALLKKEVPLNLAPGALDRKPADKEKLQALFQEWSFKSLGNALDTFCQGKETPFVL
jgi:DNA polymerase I